MQNHKICCLMVLSTIFKTYPRGPNALQDTIIRISHLTYSRGSKTILKDVSMDIERGSIVAIMGPSGVGKTTILRLISGQLHPDHGSVEVNGQMISGLSQRELYKSR